MNLNFKNIEGLISSVLAMFGTENVNFQTLLNSFMNYFGIKNVSADALQKAIESFITGLIKRWIVSIIVTAVIAVAVFLAYYILTSVAWYKLAKKHNVKFAWLSWIPFLRTYVVGETATAFSDMKFFGKWRIGYVWMILMFFPFAQNIVLRAFKMFSTIPYIGVVFQVFGAVASILLTVFFFVFRLSVLFRIYSTYVEKKYAALYTVVSILEVPIPFLLFSLLGKKRMTDGVDFEIIFDKEKVA